MTDRRYSVENCAPKAGQTFQKLCHSFPADSIPQLRLGIDAALERLSKTASDDYLGPHIGTARRIAERLNYLIDNCGKFPRQKLPLIVGAIRYFIIEEDAVPDSTPLVGFDDDIQVLNHVLEELGLEHLFVQP